MDIDLNIKKDNATLDDFTPSGEWDILAIPASVTTNPGDKDYQALLYW